jgi:hypothetical protein
MTEKKFKPIELKNVSIYEKFKFKLRHENEIKEFLSVSHLNLNIREI